MLLKKVQGRLVACKQAMRYLRSAAPKDVPILCLGRVASDRCDRVASTPTQHPIELRDGRKKQCTGG
jgi:hypothetical protein